jgi:uncharacterized protein (UPF0332 family)
MKSFPWEKFLEFSQILSELEIENEDEDLMQARFRSAISRAYYAAFGQSRKYLRKNYHFIDRKDENEHKKVADEFLRLAKEKKKINYQIVGSKLTELRQFRNNADYDKSSEDYSVRWTQCLHYAQKILSELETLP